MSTSDYKALAAAFIDKRAPRRNATIDALAKAMEGIYCLGVVKGANQHKERINGTS